MAAVSAAAGAGPADPGRGRTRPGTGLELSASWAGGRNAEGTMGSGVSAAGAGLGFPAHRLVDDIEDHGQGSQAAKACYQPGETRLVGCLDEAEGQRCSQQSIQEHSQA